MIKKFYKDILPQDDSYKLIWTLSDKKSHWFQDTDKLIQFVEDNPKNIFFGLGTTTKKLPANKRATAQQITNIRCLHKDIDIKNKAIHANAKLPGTLVEALSMASAILEPTWVIDSGHGLHDYLCMNEHQKISSDNFDYWTMLVKSWQQEHNKKYPLYHLDSTYDLSRILRCPGSMNAKDPNNIVQCKIIEHNENAYYEPEEVEDAIEFSLSRARKLSSMQRPKDSSVPATQLATKIKQEKRLSKQECQQWADDNGVSLSSEARIDGDTFHNLQTMEPEFFEEYCNKTGRKSASEYQFRIAHIAIKNGLTDQQTINLMIQHRKFNHHDLKIDRVDTYINDLVKAKRTYNIRRIGDTSNGNVTVDDKEAVRDYLFGKLGIHIHTLWRYDKDPDGYYELELSNHPNKLIYLGSMADGIMTQKKFISSIIDATKETPKQVQNKVWYYDVVQKLTKITRDGVTQETATFDGQVRLWIKDYLINKEVIADLETYIDNNVKSTPFYHQNRVYFTFEPLVRWIQTSKSNAFDSFHFSITMSKSGFKQVIINGKNGLPITLWKTPPGYMARTEMIEI